MNPPPRRVLVIVTRRIGDVLLATPVMRSLKQAWPDAKIDVLVFSSTAGVLAANTDIDLILTIPERPKALQHVVFIAKLFRRYDLAVSLVPGDRPTFYAFLAGRKRVGLLLDTAKERWKQRFLNHWVPYAMSGTHTLLTYLSVLQPLGVQPLTQVCVSWREADAARAQLALAPVGLGLRSSRYVVLHLYPKFNYKMWNDAGWIALALWISAHNLRIVLTGSNDAAELAYVRRLAGEMNAPLNLAGELTLAESAYVLAQACAYVGPDTALTHMAAALGVPTVTLFGPTDPVKWGPWPKHHNTSHAPWQRLGDQHCGNVRLLQGRAPCAPCNFEGCDRHVASVSDCLVQLPAARVIQSLSEVINVN